MESLQQLLELNRSLTYARTVHVAVQFGVFTHVAEGKKTAADVAEAAGTDARATRMLLDALTALGLLTKEADRYALTPVSERHLVKTSPEYTGHMLERDEVWAAWSGLPEAIRTGTPCTRVDDQEGAEAFFDRLVRSLHVISREPAVRAAQAVNPEGGPVAVLDIGSGSGTWSIPYAEQNPASRVTACDFEKMLAVTREHAERHGVAGQYEFLAGDLKAADFGENRFDVAILGNILHSEGEPSGRDLLMRLHRALSSGGHVCIFEHIANDDRTGPAAALVFALNMLLHTAEGDVFTRSQMDGWLVEAGFETTESAGIGWHSPLLFARKR